ncbi:hypothetical protein ACFLUU_09465, partial [Chloroflexota bacterium]
GGGGGGGGAAVVVVPTSVVTVSPGVYDVLGAIDSEGSFGIDVTLKSADSNVKLDIAKNTKGETKWGSYLWMIEVTEMAEPPVSPADGHIIGLVYELAPDGATFDPPITLTFTYDPIEISETVDESSMVIARWDKDANEWITLEDSIVDPETYTISASVSYFTIFTIINRTAIPRTAPEEIATAGIFSVSNLYIYPANPHPGDEVRIVVSVANTGDAGGSYIVSLSVDGRIEEERTINVAAGDSQLVDFYITREKVGRHSVIVGGLRGSFTIEAPAPPVEKKVLGTFIVVGGEEEARVNWLLIGVIIALVILIGVLIWQVRRLRLKIVLE